MAKYCVSCGSEMDDNQTFCPNCGAPQDGQTADNATAATPSNQTTPAAGQKSKLVAGLLGIFLGGWGVHNFYLGYTSKAVIQIVVTIVTCGIGSIWGLIEGILILVGNISTDANGNPLGD